MTELSRTVFSEEGFGWPASAGPVSVDLDKSIQVAWDKDTVVHGARVEVRISHTYLSGVEVAILVNGKRAGTVNWAALDTGVKTGTFDATLVNGTNRVRIIATTGSFVFPGSNQGGTVHYTNLKVKFGGDPPRTTQARTSIATSATDFLNQLSSAAPWLVVLLGAVGIVILIILIRLRGS